MAQELSRVPPIRLLRPSCRPWSGLLSLQGVVARLAQVPPRPAPEGRLPALPHAGGALAVLFCSSFLQPMPSDRQTTVIWAAVVLSIGTQWRQQDVSSCQRSAMCFVSACTQPCAPCIASWKSTCYEEVCPTVR